MKISNTGLNLIAKWEGFRATAYQDVGGVWTIGYGTTRYEDGTRVKKGDTITKADALSLLQMQANEHAATILSYVKVPLTQNQFDAL
ncbi:TPA: lysozyme, partial [Escherichia coli]|nr:lysozyme [Escherichia coli]